VSARLALVLALLFGALVAYLTALNTGRVQVQLGEGWTYEPPLMALVVGAFLAGAGLVLFLTLLRDLGRSFRDHALLRRRHRDESLAEVYHRGVDAQLAGRAAEAREAYEEVLSREPGHAEAHLRLGEMARGRGDHGAALEHHLHALRGEERADTLLAVALDYQHVGRVDEALATYRRLLQRDRGHLTALRAIRDLTVRERRWAEALLAQKRIAELAAEGEQARESEWLAGIHYELGKAALAAGKTSEGLERFREALRAHRLFLPAQLALGDAHLAADDAREAVRTWERALAEGGPALPLLRRLEDAYRAEGRPSRMIALYQEAAARAPQDLALAFALGRVYFELEMLDEAADQFQKVEVRAPELAPLHAYLGTIFERRGQTAEAFQEYRRALALAQGYEWPHRCAGCGLAHRRWQDRCPGCGRWNTSHP
jgi:lipopolysaccharide biosynthesis regulator YciM